VIRSDRFVMSHKQFAVNLGSLRTVEHTRADGSHYYGGRVNAVWYRRRSGITVACIGELWDYQDGVPTSDPLQFLAQHADGRYGGDCHGRWDGASYWGGEGTLETQEQHLAILRPMLDQCPVIMPGYDGWWRFS
jgi:hypothetical protein